jgi:hypothetical protein
MYRWHNKYPLGPNPWARLTAPVVLSKIRQFAKDFDLYSSTEFKCEITKAKYDEETDW